MRKSALEQTKRKTPLGTKGKVPCPYCPETFRRAQGRAAHIRYSHPGMPYRPEDAKSAKNGKNDVPVVRLVDKPEEPQPAPQAAPEPEATTRQHLVTAIKAIKRRTESMRAVQQQMEIERQVLMTALASLDGTTINAVQEAFKD